MIELLVGDEITVVLRDKTRLFGSMIHKNGDNLCFILTTQDGKTFNWTHNGWYLSPTGNRQIEHELDVMECF